MLKKFILLGILTTISLSSHANDWINEEYAEDGKYSLTAMIASGKNRFEYKCSVFKFDDAKFGMVENINLDLDLKLEEDKLHFQDNYDVNIIYSNGLEFKNQIQLKAGMNNLDRFSLYLNPRGNTRDNNIITNLSNRSYVNVEIVDGSKKRMLYRFYLNGSKKAIQKARAKCIALYDTFK